MAGSSRLMKVVRNAAISVIIIAFGAYIWLAPPAQHDETLFYGGDVVTVTGGTANALLVRDGRIVAVGDYGSVAEQATDAATRVDLMGRALLPGLIEPHTHPVATAQFGATVDVSGFTHSTRASIMTALEEAADGFTANGWIMAFGWDPVMVDDLTAPTPAELDAIAPEKPLVILTQMMHDAYANSAALRAAGITETTPNPMGGEFIKDENGRLTGVVREVSAIKALFANAPKPPLGANDLLVNLQLGAYARAGFTTIAAAGLVGSGDDLPGLMKRLTGAKDAPVQAVTYGLPHQIPASGGPEDAQTPGAIIGVKFWMDGSPYAGGAAFAEPYETTDLTTGRLHLEPGHMGALNHETSTFRKVFEAYHKRGYQIAVHVQGERAVGRVLDVVESVLADYPRTDHRHRLEHNALISREQLQRAARLGMTTGFFVDHVTFYGHRLPELVGEARTARYMPTRTALDAGLRISLHSDNPATPIGPLRTFKAAITRQPRRSGPQVAPDQALTPLEALRAMTIDAAWQLGLDRERGSLEVGKAADLVLMSANPLTVDPARIEDIRVEATWIGGRQVDARKTTRTNAGLVWDMLMGML
ncbi:amidohydrolase [Kordiimonas lipolytica]|uniref:Amidohydrolase n=1 Tax=Kordiimonas lipolytica TaxID=1662421 RepID=A0ABV8UC89_9PROT|nr:amidohydrolase [Kordiimonas lipolytica]